MIADLIRRVISGENLSSAECEAAFDELMEGAATDVQKAALLVALRMKGETSDEIIGAARAMRARVVRVESVREDLVDTCGTGGDGAGIFNVSTVAAFVAAGAGVPIAKHGNRAVSSACGSADVLAALGVNVDLDAAAMSGILDRVGISFLFAPRLHPAMAAVMPVRRELGVRTIFNLLGPLTNPAGARRQVIGVYDARLVRPIADALRELGSLHVLVVHSRDGLDEISIAAPTAVAELRDGMVREYEITPESIGVLSHPLAALSGGDAATNARIAREALSGEPGASREIVIANAAAAIYVGGLAADLPEGVARARTSIDSGSALARLEALIASTNDQEAPA